MACQLNISVAIADSLYDGKQSYGLFTRDNPKMKWHQNVENKEMKKHIAEKC